MSYDINADGSQVVFTTEDPAVVAGQVDSSTADDGFLFERATGTVTLVSRTATSAKTTGDGYLTDAGVLANDGTVAFLSNSTNLVNGQVDTNTRIDLFLYKAPYKVFLGDAKVVEGENGSRTVNLPVTLSEPSSAPVNFTYATANLSATQPADYKSKTGTLSIPAGTAGTSLVITVYGDTSDDDASSGVRLAVGDVTLYEGGQRQPDGTADRQPVEAGYLDGDRGLHNRQRQRHRRG